MWRCENPSGVFVICLAGFQWRVQFGAICKCRGFNVIEIKVNETVSIEI
jgi:hypothetical protein